MAKFLTGLRAISGGRFLLLLFCYGVVLSLSLVVAYELRFDFAVPEEFRDSLPVILVWTVFLKLFLLFVFGQYAGLLTYFSLPDLQRVFGALTLGSIILGLVRWVEGTPVAPPRGVILADFLLSFLGVAGLRLGFRLIGQFLFQPAIPSSRNARRVAILGAGDVGASLARELMIKRGLGLKPVAFFDDDPAKQYSRVHGIPVVGPVEMLTEEGFNLHLDQVIIAMPSAAPARINEIVRVLQKARLRFETVPALDQLATGQVRVTELRSVEVEDLLGREPVALETEQIASLIRGRVVMVTGAGGTIGGGLCQQIVKFHPAKLLLVDQSEVQMFEIEQTLAVAGYREQVFPLVADVLDRERMSAIFQQYRPALIFHAAAHKHVPLMEGQPGEAIRNNVFGTVTLAELAVEFGAEQFVFISTDKAINPTNVMGATKRLAEIFLQSFHAESGGKTKFMAVRFGNVLGSSGSVIPTFKKQIAAGGPVKVTHPEVTRYFMTVGEAVGLVLQSATQGKGGEIFVLDMGQSIRIVELARQMVELSGLRPDEDIAIEFVGLRPGEKLFEELCYHSESMERTSHVKVMRFRCEPEPLSSVRRMLAQMGQRLTKASATDLKLLLKEAVTEYEPYLDERDSADAGDSSRCQSDSVLVSSD